MPEYLMHRTITRTQSVQVVAASQEEAKQKAKAVDEGDYSLPKVEVRHKVICWSDSPSVDA